MGRRIGWRTEDITCCALPYETEVKESSGDHCHWLLCFLGCLLFNGIFVVMHEHLAKCDMCDRTWHFWILLTIFGVGHFRFFTTRGSTELKADIQDLEPVGARKAQVNQMISYAWIILFVFYRINIMIFKYIYIYIVFHTSQMYDNIDEEPHV